MYDEGIGGIWRVCESHPEAVMIIEGLLWIGTGEGEIMYEKMLESDAYYTDVVALID